ncbi:MAG TPA: hypothetical protein VIG33_00980 [Pseudobdellovibrionaceae bacterium]|jgi:hypothetical protein
MKNLKISPWRFIFLLGALHLCCASLSFAVGADTSWKMGLSTVSAQDTQSASKFVGFALDAKMKYWLHPELFANLDPNITFENGSFQSVDGERKNQSGLYLKEAGVHWLFMRGSTLSGGALNQATVHTDLLTGDQAFPALRGELELFNVGNLTTSLDLEQAIPTSNSLSTNTTSVESTPRFLSASLTLNYESTPYFWKTRVGAFSYDNLPSAVAYQSGLRGNTIVSLTESESSFVYQYQGLEAMTSLRFPLMRGWDFTTSASYLQNDKAVSTLNRAYSLSAGSEFFFVGRKSVDINLTSFRIEPDAAVAYFNSGKYFNTNRIGYNVESFIKFNKYNFKIGLGYTEAEVIYLHPIQSREKLFMLMLETFYANI